ncbi:MAG: hypothetical protein CVT92_08075 [Bacteroidetes bacterium HGW-Bacteroidetes-1]|nr:MAG: hypothetical protein CVT92_08075 [Bacteroidetes bacterium HGW-Bacteroidetes-1]
MYVDRQQPHHGYFVFPKSIEWNDFLALTKEVNYETELRYFDAAQAYIFENNKVIDLIRIYKEDITLAKLEAIQSRYLKLYNQMKLK